MAEIPGTDKAQEVVMLGGHLDSWHSATGATDNAIGSATMLEAIRILNAIGVRPRRTIRVALWSGEEQGLLGSQAYVKEHFGSFEDQKPEHARFAGYFNIDSGTGRARGMIVFGPPEAANILRQATGPFETMAFSARRHDEPPPRRLGSTSFNEAGLPGIGVQQDPIEYNSHTWHTNLDTYERIIPEDDAAERDGDCGSRVSPGDTGRAASAPAEGQDAAEADDAVARSAQNPLGLKTVARTC